jgi:hypothetical protein
MKILGFGPDNISLCQLIVYAVMLICRYVFGGSAPAVIQKEQNSIAGKICSPLEGNYVFSDISKRVGEELGGIVQRRP